MLLGAPVAGGGSVFVNGYAWPTTKGVTVKAANPEGGLETTDG